MHETLAQWANGLLENKTLEELRGMSDLDISTEIMPHIVDELKMIQKLDKEDAVAANLGEKHFVRFLPKDANLVAIAKSLYEEREKTYENLAAFLTEEQEKTMKEKYFATGTFIFPGGASYGVGPLDPEDFEAYQEK